MDDSIDWGREPDLAALRHAIDVSMSSPLEGEVLLRALVEKGSVHSMVHLGYLYSHRAQEAGGPDLPKAEHWYRLAGDAGSRVAMFHLGRLYLKLQDVDKARAAFEVGARNGHAPCIFHLGRIYRDGLGVEPQIEKARALFENATNLDHIYAKRALGRLLLSGYFGLLQRFRGLSLVLSAAIEATREIQANPKSEKLKI